MIGDCALMPDPSPMTLISQFKPPSQNSPPIFANGECVLQLLHVNVSQNSKRYLFILVLLYARIPHAKIARDLLAASASTAITPVSSSLTSSIYNSQSALNQIALIVPIQPIPPAITAKMTTHANNATSPTQSPTALSLEAN